MYGAENWYLLCYDDVIVEINFDWEPTAEQMKIAGGETQFLEMYVLNPKDFASMTIIAGYIGKNWFQIPLCTRCNSIKMYVGAYRNVLLSNTPLFEFYGAL